MKKYIDLTTGELWTEDEVREAFLEALTDDSFYEKHHGESFEEYMDSLLAQGRAATGGMMEMED